MKQAPPFVEAVGISKQFGSLKAVDDVALSLPPGSFHALLGENGAGKSTLVKCLMGFYAPDAGEIRIDGSVLRTGSPQASRRHGIGMVFQHFTLIPSMTVAENLVLARPDLPLVIDWKTELARLAEFLKQAPFQVDLGSRIADLSAGQKQKVEILKEIYLETRFLILDEPTSVLTPQEADEVLGFLRRLTVRGELSVLLITHKFREVLAFCDGVTVLRRGRMAGSGRIAELDTERMASMMMGEAIMGETASANVPVLKKASARKGLPLLRLESLRAIGDNGREAVHGVDLTVHEGEIVGIAGVSGNGQRELVEAIGGQRAIASGRVTVAGERHLPTRAMLRRHRFFTLPEEPLRNAAVPSMSVAENIAFRLFDQKPFQRAGFLLDRGAIVKFGREMIQKFSVRPPDPDAPLGDLSGGNVQRGILARELSSGEVRALVAANPCFGLDFKAVKFVHDRLTEARNNGAAVLLISEDLDELLMLADRIFVMSDGQLVHETTPEQADIAEIGRRMAGHHQPPADG
jgi:general nucleoside transport system ATP-binding protein